MPIKTSEHLCGAQMRKYVFTESEEMCILVQVQTNLKSYFSSLDQVSVPSNGHHQHEEAQRLRGEKQKHSRIKIFSPPLPKQICCCRRSFQRLFKELLQNSTDRPIIRLLNTSSAYFLSVHPMDIWLRTSTHPDAPLHHVCVRDRRAGQRRSKLTLLRINFPPRQSRIKHFNQSKRTPIFLSLPPPLSPFSFACKSNLNHPPYERRLWKWTVFLSLSCPPRQPLRSAACLRFSPGIQKELLT